jgi:hypothetical protein
MTEEMGHIRVGLSGWLYPGCRGVFYPKGLRQKDELTYVSPRVDTIEINGPFYSLQRPELFAATPEGFVFGSYPYDHPRAGRGHASTARAPGPWAPDGCRA